MTLLCAYCFYAKPFTRVPAEFTINGQSVCENHVDRATDTRGFGRSLIEQQNEDDRTTP